MHTFRTAALIVGALAITAPAAVGANEEPSGIAVKRGDRTVGGLPATAEPLFSRRHVRELERRAREQGQEVPELDRWYRLPPRPRPEAEREARRIRDELGDHAHVIEPPAPPPVDDEMCKLPPPGGWPAFPPEKSSPSLVPYQDYRTGAGFSHAPGVDGSGVEIATIEYSWNPGHESLQHLDLDHPYFEFWWSHGNAVLGLLGGSDGDGAVRGLVPGAKLGPVSPIAPTGFNLPGAIVQTAAGLDVGDILLIEQQAWVPAYPEGILGPAEIDPAVREAVEAAVASGVTVVQPAGNNAGGGLDIVEDLGLEGDSGAIIVSAGGSPQRDDHGHRAGFSNYGPRVDFHAQGEALVSAGYGDLTPGLSTQRQYSACFGGTSGAAAIVAAVAAGVQGEARERGLPPLGPGQLRARLRVGALPQHAPEADGLIGPQPWVPAAADFDAPAKPALQAPAIDGSTVTLRWTSDPDAAGSVRRRDEVYVDDRLVHTSAPGSGSRTLTGVGAGSHTWSVRSADAAGNVSESHGGFQVPHAPQTAGSAGEHDTGPPARKRPPRGTKAEPKEAVAITRAATRVRPAARRVKARWLRRKGLLVLQFKGLAPRAVVRVSGRRALVRKGRAVVVRRTRAGRVGVVVRAPRRGAVRYRAKRFRVTVGTPRAIKAARARAAARR